MNWLPLLEIFGHGPQENRTKAVERRMIYVIPRCEFQSSRYNTLSNSAQPLDYSAGISDRRVWTPSLKNSGLRSATKGRECQKDFRVTTFIANIDPTPACPPREALSSVILVGVQFRCVPQNGRKSDNQMPNVTCGRVSRSASPSPANSSWKRLFKVLLSSNLQIHFRRSKKILIPS